MKDWIKTGLGVLLAVSVTACLSAGIASATTTGTKRAHSCCPVSSSQPSQPAKTTAGVPTCCLVLLQGKVANVVLLALGFQAVAVSPETFTPATASLAAALPSSDLLVRFLSRAILSIRAPPLS